MTVAGNWNTVRIVQSFPVGTVLGSISNQPLELDPTSIHDRVPNANAKRHFYARSQIYGIPKYAILKPSTQPCRYATVFVVSAAASAAACAAPASSANRLRKLR